MNFSCLSEAEVRYRYRMADDKVGIVQVLAELTCCSQEEMRNFLGIKKPERKEPSKVDHEKALKLYMQGLNDAEISRRLNVSDNAVHLWRRRNKLPSNYKPYTREEEEKRLALWRQGLNDREIGDAIGVKSRCIAEWRRVRGLAANIRPGQYKRKKMKK